MNWDKLSNKKDILEHWQKLGQFRANHPAVGAGAHKTISQEPFVFSRNYSNNSFKDEVIVALELSKGKKEINVGNVFEDGTNLYDAYSKQNVEVTNGKITLDSQFEIVLLEKN